MHRQLQNNDAQCSVKQKGQASVTVWYEIFARVYFSGLAIFCVLRELIFAIRTVVFARWELIFGYSESTRYPALLIFSFL